MQQELDELTRIAQDRDDELRRGPACGPLTLNPCWLCKPVAAFCSPAAVPGCPAWQSPWPHRFHLHCSLHGCSLAHAHAGRRRASWRARSASATGWCPRWSSSSGSRASSSAAWRRCRRGTAPWQRCGKQRRGGLHCGRGGGRAAADGGGCAGWVGGPRLGHDGGGVCHTHCAWRWTSRAQDRERLGGSLAELQAAAAAREEQLSGTVQALSDERGQLREQAKAAGLELADVRGRLELQARAGARVCIGGGGGGGGGTPAEGRAHGREMGRWVPGVHVGVRGGGNGSGGPFCRAGGRAVTVPPPGLPPWRSPAGGREGPAGGTLQVARRGRRRRGGPAEGQGR
jgi:hypothetical protein